MLLHILSLDFLVFLLKFLIFEDLCLTEIHLSKVEKKYLGWSQIIRELLLIPNFLEKIL